MIAEAYTARQPEKLAEYVRKDEFHQSFAFDLLLTPWIGAAIRSVVAATLGVVDPSGGRPAWALNNHDVQRAVTRYGRADATSDEHWTDNNLVYTRAPVDVAVGTRRARAAIMLVLALPGATYLYQGEELGLAEVLDLPDEARQDPVWFRTGGAELGRDGCRVPLPWTDDPSTAFGFSDVDRPDPPWLPQPPWWGDFAASGQRGVPESVLELYRRVLAVRRETPDLHDSDLAWCEHPSIDVVAFERGGVLVVLNTGERAATARCRSRAGARRDRQLGARARRCDGRAGRHHRLARVGRPAAERPWRRTSESGYILGMSPAPPAKPDLMERSTIEHVASAAGVSVATVSRALRGLPNVAVTTRERVEEVARALNYRPDPAASRLAAGRSRTIAIIVPLINSWYFSNVVAGAEAVCAESGYDLLILTAPNPAARLKLATSANALDRRVDGLIFVEVAVTDNDVVELERRRLGVVTVSHEHDMCSSIRTDNVEIGRIAAEHLAGLGHRRIGVIGGQAEEPEYVDVPGQRIQGAELALAAAGLQLDRDLVAPGEFTVEGGHQAALALLVAGRPADGDLRPLRRDGVRGGDRGARARPGHPRRPLPRRGRRSRGRGGAGPDHRAPGGGRAGRHGGPRPAALAHRQ